MEKPEEGLTTSWDPNAASGLMSLTAISIPAASTAAAGIPVSMAPEEQQLSSNFTDPGAVGMEANVAAGSREWNDDAVPIVRPDKRSMAQKFRNYIGSFFIIAPEDKERRPDTLVYEFTDDKDWSSVTWDTRQEETVGTCAFSVLQSKGRESNAVVEAGAGRIKQLTAELQTRPSSHEVRSRILDSLGLSKHVFNMPDVVNRGALPLPSASIWRLEDTQQMADAIRRTVVASGKETSMQTFTTPGYHRAFMASGDIRIRMQWDIEREFGQVWMSVHNLPGSCPPNELATRLHWDGIGKPPGWDPGARESFFVTVGFPDDKSWIRLVHMLEHMKAGFISDFGDETWATICKERVAKNEAERQLWAMSEEYENMLDRI